MKNFLVAIVSEGLFSLVALLVVCAIVWFGGDYFGYPVRLRVVVIVAILVIWLVIYLIQRALAVRRAMRIEAMLRSQSTANPVNDARVGPIDALVMQFRLGVQALRATRAGKDAVLRMPWFLVMGPPGSGKTAAVRESGLNFPFVGLGHRANPSAGSTRSIDWWHADKAVFLDTSGGYIADPKRHGEWQALIRQLARTGRSRPVDGVVLVVSITELLALEEDRIGDHAQNLRDRIDELAARLGMTFPVHLVFSHCDRLHGFSDFFSHFPLEQRSQAWGCTFDWNEAGPQGLQARVDEEFRRLSHVLGLRRIEALAAGDADAQNGDHLRNALLFPIQFALLQRRVGHYIAALTRPNPFQESGRLRGFWFTSAAQGGEPIDRVLSSIGLEGAAPQPVVAGEQRAYFLNGPFAHVIPADQGLARASAKATRRHRIVRGTLAAGSIGIATVLSILLVRGYRETAALLTELAADGKQLRGGDPDRQAAVGPSGELFSHLQRLAARDGIPVALYPGLQFSAELSEKARAISARPVITAYTDRLAAGIAQRLASGERSLAGYEDLHGAFRVYLMLCGRIPVDREAVQHRLAGGQGIAPEAADDRLRYIVDRIPVAEWSATADPVLIERTTHELRDALWIPLTGVEIDNAGSALYPAVDLAELLDKHATAAFTLERPVPGYYTQRAWDGFIAHAIGERAQALAQRYAELRVDLDAAAIGQRLRARYEDAYASTWRAVPSQVRMNPPRTFAAAVTGLGELGHEGSPYRTLIVAWLERKALLANSADRGLALAALALPGAKADQSADKGREWIDQSLNTIGILHAALTAYAAACPVDARLANIQELDNAVAACSAFAANAETALAAYPDEVPRRALVGHFRSLAENSRIALECEPLLESAKPVPGIAMAIPRDDLERRLLAVGIPEFPRLWREVLEGLSVPASADPTAAAARLTNLSAAQSPLAQVLRAAWRGQRLTAQLLGAQGSVTSDQAWIERSLKALAGLAAAYAPAVAAEPGPCVARSEALVHVAEAFASSAGEIEAALASIPDGAFRAAAAKPFAQLQDDARRQLFALLAEDADRMWGERVHERFARDLAPTFPFADVAQDADPKAVAAFFAPRTGALWEASRLIDAASQITIAGRPLLRCDPAYQGAIGTARVLTEALFAAEGTGPKLAFTAELRPRTGVYQAVVTIGAEHLELAENPDNRCAFAADLADPMACRIAVQTADGIWLQSAIEPKAWGLLRWAAGGKPVDDGKGRGLLTWTLPENAAGESPRTVLIQLAIDGGAGTSVISRRAFTDLAFPATITIRPQE